MNIEKLTQLANRLPCESPTLERADGTLDEIYIAYGLGDEGVIHGMWGCKGMVVHGFEFRPGTSKDQVREALLTMADREVVWFTEQGFFHA